jgi:unsaturated rhamnogalacturonyl hydrolase
MTRDDTISRVRTAMLCMQRDSWEQGMASQALLDWGDLELAILLAQDSLVHAGKDGRPGLMAGTTTVTDPASNGEAIVAAARATGEERYSEAARALLDWLLETEHRTSDGIIYHFVDRSEVWIDSSYMAPPFLALMGRGDVALQQFKGFKSLLWNQEKLLYSHIWDDSERKVSRPLAWGVGHAFAAMGMARTYSFLPPVLVEERAWIRRHLAEVLEGALSRMRPDGLFHFILDKPDSFVETNAAAMLACSIFRGVAEGSVERPRLEAALRMREAVWARVDGSGVVRGGCGAPFFDRPGSSPEGQADLIMMEAAYRRLAAGAAGSAAETAPAA